MQNEGLRAFANSQTSTVVTLTWYPEAAQSPQGEAKQRHKAGSVRCQWLEMDASSHSSSQLQPRRQATAEQTTLWGSESGNAVGESMSQRSQSVQSLMHPSWSKQLQ